MSSSGDFEVAAALDTAKGLMQRALEGFAPLLPDEKERLQLRLLTSGTVTQQFSVLQSLFSYRPDPSPEPGEPDRQPRLGRHGDPTARGCGAHSGIPRHRSRAVDTGSGAAESNR